MDRSDKHNWLFALGVGFLCSICGCGDDGPDSMTAPASAEAPTEVVASGKLSASALRYPPDALMECAKRQHLFGEGAIIVPQVVTTNSAVAPVWTCPPVRMASNTANIFRLPKNDADLNFEISDPIPDLVRLPEVASGKNRIDRWSKQSPPIRLPEVAVEPVEQNLSSFNSLHRIPLVDVEPDRSAIGNDVRSEKVARELAEQDIPEQDIPEQDTAVSWTNEDVRSLWMQMEESEPVETSSDKSVRENVTASNPTSPAPPSPIHRLPMEDFAEADIGEEPVKEAGSPALPSHTVLNSSDNHDADSIASVERDESDTAMSATFPQVDPMRAVNRQAISKIRNAFSLAQRGATYSARIELIDSLRVIAEALDMRDGTRQHTDALKRGFVALEEAEDFQQHGLAAELDLDVLVAGHRTPALKDRDLSKMTPLVCLQKYLTYAQQQLAIAGGEQQVASLAMYGLGRLQVDIAAEDDSVMPQAIVFHQAAVMTDSMNYKSANELGVLLARYGQFSQARDMLAHSIQVCPCEESWRNLAKVHQQLGQQDLARKAAYEAQLVARGSGSSHGVRWVEPAALSGSIVGNQPTIPVRRTAEEPAESPTRNVSETRTDGWMRLLPWSRRSDGNDDR